jgi:hypothetical protein
MTLSDRLSTQARTHWFVMLLPFLLLVEYGFARSTDWSRPGAAEFAILFDLCLFVPFLYFLCYRGRLATRALLLRSAALLLAGIWLATWLVPPEGRSMLDQLGGFRAIGLVMLAVAELGAMLIVIRLVFSGRSSAEISARSGAPEWVARLMLLEARFWKAVWRLIRRR